MDSSNLANLRSKAAIFSAIDTFVISSVSTLGNLDTPKPSVTNKGNLLASDNFLGHHKCPQSGQISLIYIVTIFETETVTYCQNFCT